MIYDMDNEGFEIKLNPEDVENAEKCKQALQDIEINLDKSVVPIQVQGVRLNIPTIVYGSLVRIIYNLAQGNLLELVESSKVITTGRAAEIIGCTRAQIVVLTNANILPCFYTGTHRRLLLSDVLKYKNLVKHKPENRKKLYMKQADYLYEKSKSI